LASSENCCSYWTARCRTYVHTFSTCLIAQHLYYLRWSCDRCCLNRILERTTSATSGSARDTARSRNKTAVLTKTSGPCVNSHSVVIICCCLRETAVVQNHARQCKRIWQ